jgi:Mrp family chromosome partitioning ATPase
MEIIHAVPQKAREQRGSAWDLDHELALHSEQNAANWEKLRRFEPDPGLLRANRIVTVDRVDPASRSFDMLRTKVLQKARQNGWKSIAITSPTPGSGKSLTSANLAFSMASQKNCRTLLIDLDLRRPQIATLLGIDDPLPIAEMLGGSRRIDDFLLRCADNLAVVANRTPVKLPAELLQHPNTASCIARIKQSPQVDIAIFDLPPMLASDDAISFLPNVDAVLLVLESDFTTPEEADICEYELSQITNVVGVVLNKCRFSPDSRVY